LFLFSTNSSGAFLLREWCLKNNDIIEKKICDININANEGVQYKRCAKWWPSAAPIKILEHYNLFIHLLVDNCRHTHLLRLFHAINIIINTSYVHNCVIITNEHYIINITLSAKLSKQEKWFAEVLKILKI